MSGSMKGRSAPPCLFTENAIRASHCGQREPLQPRRPASLLRRTGDVYAAESLSSCSIFQHRYSALGTWKHPL